MPEVKVAFDDAAAYERVMGRWSGAVGARFLDWLAPTSGLRWLDAAAAQALSPSSYSSVARLAQ